MQLANVRKGIPVTGTLMSSYVTRDRPSFSRPSTTRDNGLTDTSAEDQSDLLSAFSKRVAGPLIELLPPHTAAFAVLMLYEEFVQAVFIQPALEADVGNEG